MTRSQRAHPNNHSPLLLPVLPKQAPPLQTNERFRCDKKRHVVHCHFMRGHCNTMTRSQYTVPQTTNNATTVEQTSVHSSQLTHFPATHVPPNHHIAHLPTVCTGCIVFCNGQRSLRNGERSLRRALLTHRQCLTSPMHSPHNQPRRIPC